MYRIDVRPATEADAVELANLVNAAYRPPAGSEGWTHESGLVAGQRIQVEQAAKAIQEYSVLVGVHGSEIVACVQIQCKGSEAYIGLLAVRPSLQGAGVGKYMMDRAESLAILEGVSEFRLLVLSNRTALIEFYRRRGYEEFGEPVAYPIDAGAGVPIVEGIAVVTLRKFSNTSLQSTSTAAGEPGSPA